MEGRIPTGPIPIGCGMNPPALQSLTFRLRMGRRDFPIRLTTDVRDGAIVACRVVPGTGIEKAASRTSSPGIEELRAFAAGQRTDFTVPMRPVGTPFQCRVWALVREIPFGATRTYGEIARQLGKPGAARAVGQACRANPLLVLVPCHRVVGVKGMPCGYAGGAALLLALQALEGRAKKEHEGDERAARNRREQSIDSPLLRL